MTLLARNERLAASAGATGVVRVEGGAAPDLADDETVLVLCGAHVYDRRVASAIPRDEAGESLALTSGDRALPVFHGRFREARGLLDAQSSEELAARAHRIAQRTRSAGERLVDVDVRDAASAARATDALWESCRKPIDGYVSRYLNRHVSLFVSRRIVDTGIRPNHVSILCIVLGVVGALLAAQGSYWFFLAGALVFQANSIIDGIDGELARVRWQGSKTGELLDSAGDNLSNFSFFIATAWVAFRAHDTLFATLGAAGLSLWALYLAFLYGNLAKMGRGDVLLVRTALDRVATGPVAASVRFLRALVRRDSFVFATLVFAALGVPRAILVMVAIGAR
ncbi:MAG TPA: CDP-alcohol phosphatidyltransferase family protein [Polyangia bacterium]